MWELVDIDEIGNWKFKPIQNQFMKSITLQFNEFFMYHKHKFRKQIVAVQIFREMATGNGKTHIRTCALKLSSKYL